MQGSEHKWTQVNTTHSCRTGVNCTKLLPVDASDYKYNTSEHGNKSEHKWTWRG